MQTQLNQLMINHHLILTDQDQQLKLAQKQIDCDTVSQKSQISKTPSLPMKIQQESPQSEVIRKSTQKEIKQGMKEIASNNGTPKKGFE